MEPTEEQDWRIRVDARRGHIVIYPHNTDRHRDPVTFSDLGSVLALWSYEGIELTPPMAAELGQALLDWSVRKMHQVVARADAGGPYRHSASHTYHPEAGGSLDGMQRPGCSCGWKWSGYSMPSIAKSVWEKHIETVGILAKIKAQQEADQ